MKECGQFAGCCCCLPGTMEPSNSMHHPIIPVAIGCIQFSCVRPGPLIEVGKSKWSEFRRRADDLRHCWLFWFCCAPPFPYFLAVVGVTTIANSTGTRYWYRYVPRTRYRYRYGTGTVPSYQLVFVPTRRSIHSG